MRKINDNIFSDAIFIEYQKEYYKNSNFVEILFKGNDNNNNTVEYPITIEDCKNIKSLNNYNSPIYLDDLNLNLDSYKNIVNELKKICDKENINSILFKKKISENELKKKLEEKKDSIDFIGIESTIKLDEDLKSIQRKFSKGHRSALKINYENLSYELFDFKNYKKNQIFEMMDLHEKVSGKKTRSKETWEINEKMILSKKGLLIRVKENSRLISYAFIFFNKNSSIYFSSCTMRDIFKLYKNITHKIIWESIKYLKSANCKNFHLGTTKSLYSKKEIDEKSKNIDLFKSSFGGEKNFFVIYNNLQEL